MRTDTIWNKQLCILANNSLKYNVLQPNVFEPIFKLKSI